MENKIDIFEVLENTLKNKRFHIQKDMRDTATVQVEAGTHKDAIKALMDVDKKAALTAITGLDLGVNIGVLYHVRLTDGFVTVRVEVPKDNPSLPLLLI